MLRRLIVPRRDRQAGAADVLEKFQSDVIPLEMGDSEFHVRHAQARRDRIGLDSSPGHELKIEHLAVEGHGSVDVCHGAGKTGMVNLRYCILHAFRR